MGFVYAFKLKNNDELRYVGITKNIQKRYIGHKNSASRGENLPLYRWIRSKGIDNIEMIILEEATMDQLSELEVMWISKLKEDGHRLLNLTAGGEGTIGHKHSKEQKTKWSNERKGSIAGDKNPNYGKFGPYHPAYGRKLSEEAKERLSKRMLGANNPNYGKKYSLEERKKMSDTRKGKPMPSSARSAHTRWHTNKNKVSDSCSYCKESK